MCKTADQILIAVDLDRIVDVDSHWNVFSYSVFVCGDEFMWPAIAGMEFDLLRRGQCTHIMVAERRMPTALFPGFAKRQIG